MKFNTLRDTLLKGLQTIQTAITSKSTLPILSNILIEATQEDIILTSTDLEIGIVARIPIKPAVAGAITIPAKKFSDIIKEMPETEEISVSVKKNNQINIECGKNIFKIMGLPKDEFPQLPELKDGNPIIIGQGELKKMINTTKFAISRDETRYVLNGILFVIKPAYIRLVATDGRRLAMIEQKTQLPKTLERRCVVPTKAINELSRILSDEGEAKIFLSENQIFFEAGPTRLVSRLIEGEFPSYEQVIPKETKDKIVVERDTFLSAIRKVALFTNPDSMAVRVEAARDKLVFSKNAPYLGEARVEIAAEYKGKDLAAGFNPDYLMDFLKSTDQRTVNFELVDSERPGVIRIGDEYVYVVLPMQVA